MKKFRITGWETVRFDYIVEAESLDDVEDWNYFQVHGYVDERIDGDIDTIEEVK